MYELIKTNGGIQMNEMREMMRKFVIAVNNIDEVYCSDTAQIGVKESELWLLYALDDEKPHSQKQICEEWGFPRTTLNTTIKQAQAQGYLTLSPIPGKRREKNVCLTDSGKAYAKQVLRTIYEAEDQAMAETLERYSIDFIEALEFFSTRLKSAFQKDVDISEENDT